MLCLVSGSTKTVKRLVANGQKNLGVLLTPANGNSVRSVVDLGVPYAIDNGAFSGFDSVAFEKLLIDVEASSRKPMWVACPDVVGDAMATYELWQKWHGKISGRGLPVAYVLQDGQNEIAMPPWPFLSAVFVGGSTEFKLGSAAAELVERAKRMRKLVHMGRVNSMARMELAWHIGCDSVDGTSMSMFGDTYVEKFCNHSQALQAKGSLFRPA